MHAQTHTFTHTFTHTHTQEDTLARTHESTHTRTHARTYAHTYAHTHTHERRQSISQSVSLSVPVRPRLSVRPSIYKSHVHSRARRNTSLVVMYCFRCKSIGDRCLNCACLKAGRRWGDCLPSRNYHCSNPNNNGISSPLLLPNSSEALESQQTSPVIASCLH